MNGRELVITNSPSNSDSPKSSTAHCPAGKVVVGTGASISGGKSGSFPNQEADILIDSVTPSNTSVFVDAFEDEPISVDWLVSVTAICATAP